MKKCHILTAAFAIASLATNAQAQGKFEYSYAELNYVSISDGSSYNANIQYEVKPQIYLFGGYTMSETDVTVDIAGGGGGGGPGGPGGAATTTNTITETGAGFLGVGYHKSVSTGIRTLGDRIDIYGEVGYMMGTATVEIDGAPEPDIDVTGVVGAVGARAFVKPKIEVEGSFSIGPEDFGGASLTARYYFRDKFSVGGGLIEGDLGIGLRANF